MSPSRSLPGPFSCLRIGPWSVAQVLRRPLALGLVFLFSAALIALFVLPYYRLLDEHLAGNPLSSGREGRILFMDLGRQHPEVSVVLGGATILALLALTFFAGGILGTLGLQSSRRLGLSDFLAESGNHFFRSLRTLIPALFLLLIWTWLWEGFVHPFLTGLPLHEGEPARQVWTGLLSQLVFLLGLGKILVLRRLALGDLVLGQRSSALLAWLRSLGFLIRHPLATTTAFLGLVLTWGLGALVAFFALEGLFEGEGSLLPVLLVSQAYALFHTSCNMGSFLVARRLLVLDAPDEEAEPAFAVPSQTPRQEPVAEVFPDESTPSPSSPS